MTISDIIPILVAATGPIIVFITGLITNKLNSNQSKQLFDKQLSELLEPMMVEIDMQKGNIDIDAVKRIAYSNYSLVPAKVMDIINNWNPNREEELRESVESNFNWVRKKLYYPHDRTKIKRGKVEQAGKHHGLVELGVTAAILGIVSYTTGYTLTLLVKDGIVLRISNNVLIAGYFIVLILIGLVAYRRL